MKGTRAQIVALLRERGECSVTDLADAVGIAPAALRRHLEILAGEGTVEYRSVKQPAGRPYFAYRLTAQAREKDAAVTVYPRLVERLVTEVAALGPEQTADKSGADLLALVFRHMSAQMADEYRGRVRGATLEERVRSLTEALRGEGIVEQWGKAEDGFHLTTSACPHRRAALAAHGLCASELQTIAALLGAEVEQVRRVVDGASCCEYVVREPSAVSGQPSAPLPTLTVIQ